MFDSSEYEGIETTPCTDSILELVDEITDEFADTYDVQQDLLENLKSFCGDVDTALYESDSTFEEASVDTESFYIDILIKSSIIHFRSEYAKKEWLEVFKKAKSVKLASDGDLYVVITVPGVWVKK